MQKYAVAVVALRDISANSRSRHTAIPRRDVEMMVSRPKKYVVLAGSNRGLFEYNGGDQNK